MKYSLFGPELNGAMPPWQEVDRKVPSEVLLGMRLKRDFPGMLLWLGLAGVFEPQPEPVAADAGRERHGGDHWTGTYIAPGHEPVAMQLHANDPGWRPFIKEASTATLGARIFWDSPARG